MSRILILDHIERRLGLDSETRTATALVDDMYQMVNQLAGEGSPQQVALKPHLLQIFFPSRDPEFSHRLTVHTPYIDYPGKVVYIEYLDSSWEETHHYVIDSAGHARKIDMDDQVGRLTPVTPDDVILLQRAKKNIETQTMAEAMATPIVEASRILFSVHSSELDSDGKFQKLTLPIERQNEFTVISNTTAIRHIESRMQIDPDVPEKEGYTIYTTYELAGAELNSTDTTRMRTVIIEPEFDHEDENISVTRYRFSAQERMQYPANIVQLRDTHLPKDDPVPFGHEDLEILHDFRSRLIDGLEKSLFDNPFAINRPDVHALLKRLWDINPQT